MREKFHAKINARKYIDSGKGFTCVSFSLKNITYSRTVLLMT